MNSKLPSRPKTSSNLKLCFIEIVHLTTYIQLTTLVRTLTKADLRFWQVIIEYFVP